MIPVPVTMRSRDADVPSIEVQGYAPSPDSPLVVTRWHIWDRIDKEWRWDEANGYCITHRQTGFHLGSGKDDDGKATWCDLATAYAVLLRCDPAFPAWPLAGDNEAARQACRLKFKWACGT